MLSMTGLFDWRAQFEGPLAPKRDGPHRVGVARDGRTWLDQSTMLYVHVTMASYVQGIAVNLESEVEAEQNTVVTSDQWMESRDSIPNSVCGVHLSERSNVRYPSS
jgi:hypothetical protein